MVMQKRNGNGLQAAHRLDAEAFALGRELLVELDQLRVQLLDALVHKVVNAVRHRHLRKHAVECRSEPTCDGAAPAPQCDGCRTLSDMHSMLDSSCAMYMQFCCSHAANDYGSHSLTTRCDAHGQHTARWA